MNHLSEFPLRPLTLSIRLFMLWGGSDKNPYGS